MEEVAKASSASAAAQAIKSRVARMLIAELLLICGCNWCNAPVAAWVTWSHKQSAAMKRNGRQTTVKPRSVRQSGQIISWRNSVVFLSHS